MRRMNKPEHHKDTTQTAAQKSVAAHREMVTAGELKWKSLQADTLEKEATIHQIMAQHYSMRCVRCSLTSHLLIYHLDSVGVLEQLRKLALLGLELRVTTNVLLADEDAGDGALLGHLLEGVLDGGAIVCA